MEVPHHRNRQLWRYELEEKLRNFRVLPRRWVMEKTFARPSYSLPGVRRVDEGPAPETVQDLCSFALHRGAAR